MKRFALLFVFVVLASSIGVLHAAEKSKPAEKTKPAAKAKPAAAGQDLFDGKTLSGWKSTDFGGQGKVHVDDGRIVMDRGDSMTGITWTGTPPRTNYELSLEGMRLEGNDFFCTTTFPVGKDYCSLVMGGWGGGVVGLSSIDHFDASENSTNTNHEFKDKTWYRVRIRVTDAKIQAWINSERVGDQEARGTRSTSAWSATNRVPWASAPGAPRAPCGTSVSAS